jgi:hypothetical protein
LDVHRFTLEETRQKVAFAHKGYFQWAKKIFIFIESSLVKIMWMKEINVKCQ